MKKRLFGGTLLSLFVCALIPAAPAFAHDYTVKQGYDWSRIKNDHTQWSACDAESDGQRVYAEGWYRTPQGYYDIQTVWDPDGAGGACGIGHRPRVDKVLLCETGPAGRHCNSGP